MPAAALLAASLGCGSDGDPPPPADRVDGGAPGPDAGPPPASPVEVVALEIVDGLGSDALLGDPLDLVVAPSGAPAVVYGAAPVGSGERWIRYAERTGEDTWAVEDAVRPGAQAQTQGELLALSAAVWGGTVHMAYQGGDDDGVATSQFPTDLVLATRGGTGDWSERILVDTSGEAAADCPDNQNTCNVGNVVGAHAALAVGPGDVQAVAYRDTHFGFAVDDFELADAELWVSDGPPVAVDFERGGGLWGNVGFLPDGRVVMVYAIETDRHPGIWLWLEGAPALVRVAERPTVHRVGLAVADDGTVWLAWFDPAADDLVVASASGDLGAWTTERVDQSGSVGLHPDIALGADGQPRVVYGYCGSSASRDCPFDPGSQAEVRMARRLSDGTWRIDTLDDGEGRGGVGFFNRLVALPGGRWGVAFQDARNLDVLFALVEEPGS